MYKEHLGSGVCSDSYTYVAVVCENKIDRARNRRGVHYNKVQCIDKNLSNPQEFFVTCIRFVPYYSIRKIRRQLYHQGYCIVLFERCASNRVVLLWTGLAGMELLLI